MEEIIRLAFAQNNIELLALLTKQCATDERLSLLLREGLPAVCKHYRLPSATTLSELIGFQVEKKLFTETKGSANEKLILFAKERKSEYLLKLCLEAGARPLLGVETAAEMGDVKLAQFFLAKGAVITKESKACASAAARYGHLDFLKWIHAQGAPLSVEAASEAARGGYLEVLEWLYPEGCPFTGWVCVDAAIGGHLEVLQWLRAIDESKGSVRCPWNEQVCASAKRCQKWEVLKWATENGCGPNL